MASPRTPRRGAGNFGSRDRRARFQVPDNLKTNFADECYNPNGIVPRAVAMVKAACPDATVCTDIALDPPSAPRGTGRIMSADGSSKVAPRPRPRVVRGRAGADVRVAGIRTRATTASS